MKVLSFGHIPASVGGLQSSGLANVIYRLAYHGAKQHGVEMYLAATDVFVPTLNREELTIIGWTKRLVLRHAISHPLSTIKALYNAVKCKIHYTKLVSISGLIVKSLVLDNSIKKVSPDIIHLHGANSILYYPIIPRRCKIVVTLHGNIGDDVNLENHKIHAKMENGVCSSKRIGCLCLISSNLENIFVQEYGAITPPVQIILNAFDNKVFKYINGDVHEKLTLCTIASFSKRKGQERVVDALIESGCNYRYVCIGHISDTDKAYLEKKARDIDFEWLGIKKPEEIREILAGCDYMVLPSSTEGFGLVYLEAIACGVPVIIPKHLPLALEGDILNDRNSIRIEDSSSDAICAILPSLSTRTWNRKDVAESVISYTWDNIAKEYNELYKSLLAE